MKKLVLASLGLVLAATSGLIDSATVKYAATAFGSNSLYGTPYSSDFEVEGGTLSLQACSQALNAALVAGDVCAAKQQLRYVNALLGDSTDVVVQEAVMRRTKRSLGLKQVEASPAYSVDGLNGYANAAMVEQVLAALGLEYSVYASVTMAHKVQYLKMFLLQLNSSLNKEVVDIANVQDLHQAFKDFSTQLPAVYTDEAIFAAWFVNTVVGSVQPVISDDEVEPSGWFGFGRKAKVATAVTVLALLAASGKRTTL